MQLFTRLQQQTDEEKKVIATIVAGVVALGLFLVWGVTFFTSQSTVRIVNTASQSQAKNTATKNFAETQKVLQSTVSGISQTYNDLYGVVKKVLVQQSEGIGTTTNGVVPRNSDGVIRTEDVMIGPVDARPSDTMSTQQTILKYNVPQR